ncbi:hypothetical protein ACSSVZ_005328 [Amorphus sp. MBR-141]
MIDRSHDLPIAVQARELGISRGSVYYEPCPISDADLALMRRIDELHLEYPFAGSRMLRGLLAGEGIIVGRLHIATLMKRMELEAIYRRPNTSKPAPGHKIYPYLLRKLPVMRANQVWAMDITYIPMARFDKPEIFNTDQGTQFTSIDFTTVLLAKDIKISMDGKGAWHDECLRRAALEIGETRGGVSAGLRDRQPCTGVDRQISRLLQRATSAFTAGRKNARPDLLQPAASRSGVNPAVDPPTKPPRLFRQTELSLTSTNSRFD